MIRSGIRRAFHLAVRRPDRLRREVREEIEHHLELSIEQLVAGGMAPDVARAEAVSRLGDDLPEVHRQLYGAARQRDDRMRVREWADALAQDLGQAVRSVRRAPRFALLVALTLALGIGVNASMFGIIDRLLLRGPAHVVDTERVMRLYATDRVPGRDEQTRGTFPYAAYTDVRDGSRAFAVVAAYTPGGTVSIGRGADIRRMYRQNATWTLFPLLGVRPYLGRFFTASDDRPPNGEAVAILGYDAWRTLGADPNVVGRTIVMDRVPVTVVGVAPDGFTGAELRPVDLWLPASFTQSPLTNWTTIRDRYWLRIIGRLAPGVTPAQAAGEVAALQRRVPNEGTTVAMTSAPSLRPLRFDGQGAEMIETRVSSWLMAMAAIVLLVSCANVANLLLARSIVRRREIAVRLTLGVDRGRLVRLLLLEGFVLTGVGAVLGLIAAHWGGQFVRATLLPEVAWGGSPVDGRVLLFTLGATVATGLLAGLVPALQASAPDLTGALRAGARQSGSARSPLRTVLTVAQAALCAVLLVGAGLFVRSLWNVRALDLGIETDRVLSVNWSWERALDEFPEGAMRDAERTRRNQLRERIIEEVTRVPGVAWSGLSKSLDITTLRVSGHDSLPRMPGGGPYVMGVSSNYFATVGTSIVRGRTFTSTDRAGSEPVAVVNQTMARTLWPNAEPIGQCLVIGQDGQPATCWRVVGVAENVNLFALREEPSMQYYLPYEQTAGTGSLFVRPRGEPAEFAPRLRTAVQRLDPTFGFVDVHLLREALDPQTRPWRLGATLFSLFGALAMLVGAVGLYSVMSYVGAERMPEFGVRIALGARPNDVQRLLLVRGIGTAAAGIVIGTGAALVGARRLEPLLFDTSAHDPVVFGGVVVLLLAVALVATLVPAWRVMRGDPATTLRAD